MNQRGVKSCGQWLFPSNFIIVDIISFPEMTSLILILIPSFIYFYSLCLASILVSIFVWSVCLLHVNHNHPSKRFHVYIFGLIYTRKNEKRVCQGGYRVFAFINLVQIVYISLNIIKLKHDLFINVTIFLNLIGNPKIL